MYNQLPQLSEDDIKLAEGLYTFIIGKLNKQDVLYYNTDKILERLPELDKNILILLYRDKMTTKEINQFFNRGTSWTRGRLKRMRIRYLEEDVVSHLISASALMIRYEDSIFAQEQLLSRTKESFIPLSELRLNKLTRDYLEGAGKTNVQDILNMETADEVKETLRRSKDCVNNLLRQMNKHGYVMWVEHIYNFNFN